MKRTLQVTIFAVLASTLIVMANNPLICLIPPASAQLTKDAKVAEMISKMSSTEIYNTVYALQNFTSRRTGTAGNAAAAAYLFNRLGNISRLIVEYQGNYKNVIATLPGVDPASNATYIVGAHYDSISSDPSYAPGATDDGGGVAIVLEFARIMSQYSFRHTLKFAFWNGEEGGSYGSAEYTKYLYDNRVNVSLYVNFDSSCYDPEGRMVLDIMSNPQSIWASQTMTNLNNLYGINFTLNYNAHTCSSDHQSFWAYGYTAVMTHSEEHGFAHSPADTVDKVSTEYAKRNGQLGMTLIATQAGVVRDAIPEFPSNGAVISTAMLTLTSFLLLSLKKPKKNRRV